MRRICTFVPAATASAPETTADAHPPTTARRHAARPAGSAATPDQVIIRTPARPSIVRTPGAKPAMLKIADVDTIAHRFTLCHLGGTLRRGAWREAPVASTARAALDALAPQLQRALDVQLARSLASVRSGLANTAGVVVGFRAGRAILRLRRNGPSAGALAPFNGQRRPAPAHAAVESIGSRS